MAARRFRISTPEQLRELSAFVSEGNLDAIIRVWTATKRRLGITSWDHAIYAGFSGDRNRSAEIVRIYDNGDVRHCVKLRYNLALNWCEKNLPEEFN